jgi:hypothetical protein
MKQVLTMLAARSNPNGISLLAERYQLVSG